MIRAQAIILAMISTAFAWFAYDWRAGVLVFLLVLTFMLMCTWVLMAYEVMKSSLRSPEMDKFIANQKSLQR